MKNIWIYGLIVCLFGAGSAFGLDVNYRSGFNYDIWENGDTESGSQFYLPVALETEYQGFMFQLLTAYVTTRVEYGDSFSKSLSGFSDTKVTGTYEISEELPFVLLIGLDLNLPTGQTRLDAEEQVLLRNTELISITTFGEGVNINPTVSLVKEWDEWHAGFGLGYTWRGEYDFSETTLNYDPGEVISITGEGVYNGYPDMEIRFYGQYINYGTDTVAGADYFKEGDQFALGAGVSKTSEKWYASGLLGYMITGKGDFRDRNAGMVTEADKSTGNELDITLSFHYFLKDDYTLKSQLLYLDIAENGYDEASPLYVGSRTLKQLKLGLEKNIIEDILVEGYIKISQYDEGKNWFHPGDRAYGGYSIGAIVTGGF